MKNWKVNFILLFIIWGWLEFFAKSTSVYLLMGKLFLFALLLFGPLLRAILKKEKSTAAIIYSVCFAIFFFCYFGYHEITKYKNEKCDDQFGREFNTRRLSLGVPEIPADWHAKYKWRGSVTWEAKDTAGHASKDISIDSSCAIMYEHDQYNLKPANGKTRSISIDTRYARRKGSDFISYLYEPGVDTGRYITRQQADSIFAVEKIKKDY